MSETRARIGQIKDLEGALAAKQDVLVSGVTIKTLNGGSLLGSGDIEIVGGGGGTPNVITEYAAEAGQTTFSVPGGYAVGALLVHRNGVLLQSGGYTASNGTTVTLTTPAVLGDDVKIVSSLATIPGLPSELRYSYGAFWRNEGGKIHELNDRVMVGGATVNDGLAVPVVKDWLETERDSTVKNSQVAVLSSIGQTAILGGSRTSDFPFAGSMGCIGVQGWGINDNTAQVQTAYAGYFEARRKVNTGNTHGAEINIANEGSVVDQTPDAFFPSGLSTALWIASGGELAASSATSAIAILDNGAKFRKGLVVKKEALDPSTNIAIELGQNHIIKWVSGANTAELLFNGTNIILKKNGSTVATW